MLPGKAVLPSRKPRTHRSDDGDRSLTLHRCFIFVQTTTSLPPPCQATEGPRQGHAAAGKAGEWGGTVRPMEGSDAGTLGGDRPGSARTGSEGSPGSTASGAGTRRHVGKAGDLPHACPPVTAHARCFPDPFPRRTRMDGPGPPPVRGSQAAARWNERWSIGRISPNDLPKRLVCRPRAGPKRQNSVTLAQARMLRAPPNPLRRCEDSALLYQIPFAGARIPPCLTRAISPMLGFRPALPAALCRR